MGVVLCSTCPGDVHVHTPRRSVAQASRARAPCAAPERLSLFPGHRGKPIPFGAKVEYADDGRCRKVLADGLIVARFCGRLRRLRAGWYVTFAEQTERKFPIRDL